MIRSLYAPYDLHNLICYFLNLYQIVVQLTGNIDTTSGYNFSISNLSYASFRSQQIDLSDESALWYISSST